jgi:NAD(P)-dependent dehydrogenase (short-subunit alcohol dehydrogenase family)
MSRIIQAQVVICGTGNPHVHSACGAMQVSFMKLDLASLADVRSFAERIEKLPQLDVLVCNAGIMCPLERTLTEDGMETQFQACHPSSIVLEPEKYMRMSPQHPIQTLMICFLYNSRAQCISFAL